MGKNIFRTFVFICSQFLDSKSHRFNRQISTAEFVSPNESRTCEDLRSVFFSCFFRRKRERDPCASRVIIQFFPMKNSRNSEQPWNFPDPS